MTNDQIDIKKIRLRHLYQFARDTLKDPTYQEIAPISLLRAKSQALNPQGEPNDIALLVAIHQNRCVGYHGLLPGFLQNGGRLSKILWLITFYVDTRCRGKGIGKRLVAAIQEEGVDLITTGITKGAEMVYRSAGFGQLGDLPFCQLSPTYDFFSSDGQNASAVRQNSFSTIAVDRLIEREGEDIDSRGPAICFKRDSDTINWMIRNPWVVSGGEAQEDVGNYYFSLVRERFEFVALEVFSPDRKKRLGYLVLSISRKKKRMVVKILDYYFQDPNDIAFGGQLAMEYTSAYKADRLECPVGFANFFRSQPSLAPMLKRKKRLYLYCPRSRRSPLAKLAGEIELNYCDSDTAFT